MDNKVKNKLKRRGKDLYRKYCFNSNNIIKYVTNQIDNNEPIDDSLCDVVFDITEDLEKEMYELIMFYPKKLKEIKFINKETINKLYLEYGETIEIMKNNVLVQTESVRSRLIKSARKRASENNIPFTINNEDIKLVYNCPYLNTPLSYGNTKANKTSPSIDRIIPDLGYVNGNIQIISMLGNCMKSNATKEEMLIFSKNIIKIYS